MTKDPQLDTARRRREAVLWGLGVALGLLALTAIVDGLHFANAITVDWRAQVDGETVSIARTVEHEPRFTNDHRPLARYAAGWRVAAHGVPTEIPPLDAVVITLVRIPPGAARGISARSSGAVTLSADGAPMTPERRLTPGWHRLEAHWTDTFSDSTRFELLWENEERVPRFLLHPLGGAWPRSRVGFWAICLVVIALVSVLVGRAAGTAAPTERRGRWAHVATLAVIVLGVGLRAWQYDLEPEPLENYDEYFNLWNGFSLLEDGTSRGWSAWPSAYHHEVELDHVRFWGTDLDVVSPYFENPPLMHLLVGLVCHVAGTEHYLDARVADGRLVPLVLAAITLWLMIAVGRRLVRHGPGPWLGATLYAATPTLVMQTRIIKEELLVVPLALSTLWFFLRWRDGGRRERDLVLAALCAGGGVMAKIPAAMLVPGLVMLVVASGDARAGARALAVAAGLGGVLLVAFALWQGPAALAAASGAQVTGRGLSFNLYPRFFDVLQINGWRVGRGWLLFFWLGGVVALSRWPSRQRAVLGVPIALYLTAIGVGVGNNTLGWYVLPILAYLLIATGTFLGDLYERPEILGGALFGLLFVLYTANFLVQPSWVFTPVHQPWVRGAVMTSVVVLTAPYCLAQVWPDQFTRLARRTLIGSGLATLAVAVSIVVRWEDISPVFRDMDHSSYFFP